VIAPVAEVEKKEKMAKKEKRKKDDTRQAISNIA
jgi:hypothetical protein